MIIVINGAPTNCLWMKNEAKRQKQSCKLAAKAVSGIKIDMDYVKTEFGKNNA